MDLIATVAQRAAGNVIKELAQARSPAQSGAGFDALK
jgi:hypothetical protein